MTTMRDPMPDLRAMDPSGAVAEAAEALAADPALEEGDARGETRAGLLRRAALGGGAVMGGGVVLGALTGTATGADTRSAAQDRAILNYALTLEYLEAEFYARAVAGGALTGETRTFAEIVAGHEAAHVDFLRRTLGSAAVAKPSFDFGGIPTDPARFRATAVVLEDTGVSAYIGQSYRLKRTAYILVAARVLAVEARHAAWARDMVGTRLPSERDEALNAYAGMRRVLDVVGSTGFIRG